MTFLLLLLAVVPQPDCILRDEVDLVEVNHLYNEKGQYLHDQVIWWDWNEDIAVEATVDMPDPIRCDRIIPGHPAWAGSDYEIVDWRVVKCHEILPQRDWQHGGYTSQWMDKQFHRQVHANAIRETWSQIDPEIWERHNRLPADERRGLRRPKVDPQPWTHDISAEKTDAGP